jgi:hypothetical protein
MRQFRRNLIENENYMKKEIHQNYIKASNLIFGTAVIGLINVAVSNRICMIPKI